MRCFTACFRTNSNHKKIIIKPCNSSSSKNKINSISPQALQDLLETRENDEDFIAIDDTKEEAQHDEIAKSINAEKEEARHKIVNRINLFEESKDNKEEEELNKRSRKNLLETRENGTREDSKGKEEDELNRSGRKKVTFDLNVSIYDDEVVLANQVSGNLQKHIGEEEEEEVNELSSSSLSSYISYPQNHRYHCCRNSNDEFEDMDLEDDADNNNNNVNDGGLMIQEESSSYESLFSLSIDSTRKGNSPSLEMDENKEVNSPLKQSVKFSVEDSINLLSALNPIRNPCLLKDAAITMPPSLLKKTKQQEEKENIDMNILDFTYDCAKKEPKENEVAVDTSLSSWFVECSQDDTPNSQKSARSIGNSPSERSVRREDRPILGALTAEELKDERLIAIGTIGSYLRHTGQATMYSSH